MSKSKEFPQSLPEISDGDLLFMAKRIKPVFKNAAGKLRFMEAVRLRDYAFNVDQKPAKRSAKKAEELTPAFKLTTFHPTLGFFKPTVTEILSQLSPAQAMQVVAFSTESDPGQPYGGNKNCLYSATTTFYKGKLPSAIANQKLVLQKG